MKKTDGFKIKLKLDLKFMLKRIKTLKIVKGSKNRSGLTQVKAIQYFICI